MKKLFAVLLALAMLLSCSAVFAEDVVGADADLVAAAKAEGRPYISAEEKIRQEEGEEAYQEELKKQADAAKKDEARLAKMSAEQRKALETKEAALLAEFNELRKAAGRPAVKA